MTIDEIRKLSPLILAADTDDLDTGRRIASSVQDYVDIVKIGLLLYASAGPEAASALKADGFEVFLDIKLNDIPNTVATACVELADAEPLMLTVHTTGGQEMMRAAASAVEERCDGGGIRKPLLIGVTVLTSLDLLALRKIGVSDPVEEQVLRLAKLARESSMDGLVTSPLETRPVRREVGERMVLVTPGVRLEGHSLDDQKRVATPATAMGSGADFIVAGRPVTTAKDPAEVARRMAEEAVASRALD